jgi:hypothetical protein
VTNAIHNRSITHIVAGTVWGAKSVTRTILLCYTLFHLLCFSWPIYKCLRLPHSSSTLILAWLTPDTLRGRIVAAARLRLNSTPQPAFAKSQFQTDFSTLASTIEAYYIWMGNYHRKGGFPGVGYVSLPFGVLLALVA